MTRARHASLVGIVLLLAGLVVPSDAASIRTQPQKRADYYVWLTALSEGPTAWNDLPEEVKGVKGIGFRVAVLTSEIYSTVFFEKVTYGHEGCCKKLVWTRKLDLDQFAKEFGLIGEISGFEIVRWVSPTAFEFSMHSRRFLVSDIERSTVRIEAIPTR